MQIEWLNSRLGQALFALECIQSRQALERVFGDQIIQIGNWGGPGLLLDGARTQSAFFVDVDSENGAKALMMPERLALATDSIDAVLLPHTLELSRHPHSVIREVHRVLRPDGKLIVLGFNPLSWVGLRHQLSFSGYPQGVSRHISKRRLSDWLNILNMSVDSVRPCYLSVPGNRVSKWLQRTRSFAGAYQLIATKQTMPLTIIRPRVRQAPRLVRGLVNPTTRNVA